MSNKAHFQLESLPYQTSAVEAVVQVFEGTPRSAATEQAGNRCPLTWDQLASNLQAVALRHHIADERLKLSEPAPGQPLDLCIEMETGTGQTPPREAIVCFDCELHNDTLEWLRQQKGQRVIVLEAALDTTTKWNLHHQLGDGLVVF